MAIGTLLVFIGFGMENIAAIMTIVILVASKIIPSINKLGGALTTISNVGPWIFTLNDIFKSSEELQELQIFEKEKSLNGQNLNLKMLISNTLIIL